MGGSPNSPKPAKPPPTPADPAIEDARRKELQVARNMRGRAASLLANQAELGVAPVVRKTLLGQ